MTINLRNIIRTTASSLALLALSITPAGAASYVVNNSPGACTSAAAVKGSASIVLDTKSFTNARGKVGEKVVVGTVHVSAADLPEGMTIVPSSSIQGIFTTDVGTLPAGQSETDITIYYEAKKIGKDEGRLYFMAGGNYYEEIKVSGLAIDPAAPPTLTADPMQLPEFSAKAGTADEKTITVNISGFPSSVDVKVTQDKPGFTVNTGILYYSVATHKLKVTFFPKKAGSYEAVITLSNEFIDPVEIKVKGKASGDDEQPGTEGDELVLEFDNPKTLLDEHFDGVAHNKPLSLEGWKNVAAIGQRAWWGYTFPDYEQENAGEQVAKVTAYDSKMEPGVEEEFQMLLLTPPLDYKNSASKMLTFRVMGKFMVENMSEQLMLCTIEEKDGQIMAYPIEEVVMPTLPDENGDWLKYQADLSDLDLPDVFHLGFLFVGMRGPDHSTTYFIDDVTYGRTDIPMIKTDVSEVYMESEDGAEVISQEVDVYTENLTSDVTLTLEGKYKDDFVLSSETLPSTGGKFCVAYVGKHDDGYYGVYVKLDSEGAAQKYIAFFATIVSGIQSVELSSGDTVEITRTDGIVVARTGGTSLVETLARLPQGTYVVRITGSTGTKILKIFK